MTEDRKRTRLYSEKEIGALIQRATELQREASESAERGLSLQEIEHLAAEIGIDPAHLRAAAVELESRLDADEGFRFWGGPFVLDQKRVVEGTLTEQQWEQIVRGLRRLTGSTGRIDEIGQTREWTRAIKDLDLVIERTRVTLSPGDDQTTIEVQKQYRGGAFVAYALGLVFSGTVAGMVLNGAGLPDLMNALIVGGSGAGGFAVVRTSLAFWTKRQRQRVKQLTDWLQDALAQPDPIAAAEQAFVELPDHAEEAESQARPHVGAGLKLGRHGG